MSYPEVYIIGRQVDGVYVEYLHGAEQADLFFDYAIACDEKTYESNQYKRWRMENFKVWQTDNGRIKQ